MYLHCAGNTKSSFEYAAFSVCSSEPSIDKNMTQAVHFLQERTSFHYHKVTQQSIRISFDSKSEARQFKKCVGKPTLLSANMEGNGIDVSSYQWNQIAEEWNTHRTHQMPALKLAEQLHPNEGYTLEKPIFRPCILL